MGPPQARITSVVWAKTGKTVGSITDLIQIGVSSNIPRVNYKVKIIELVKPSGAKDAYTPEKEKKNFAGPTSINFDPPPDWKRWRHTDNGAGRGVYDVKLTVTDVVTGKKYTTTLRFYIKPLPNGQHEIRFPANGTGPGN